VPEGHTIRRQANEFRAGFVGDKVVVSSPQGKFEAGAALLDGHELVRAEAAGKHLFLRFSNGRYLHVHLGLIGKWTFGDAPPPEPVGAVRVRLEGPRRWADLRGATLCEVVTPAQVRDVLARLGPDPLRRDGSREEFVRRVGRRVLPIAALLMDQEVIAGVGNVYRAEVLFRHRLSPDVPGKELDPAVAGALWDDLSVLLRQGVKTGVIVTTLPADRPPGMKRGVPPREGAHYVYRRTGEPCRICGTPVRTRELNGRNLYWCEVCQAG
jgi:DNA-formamidopyrimidine glycosylase